MADYNSVPLGQAGTGSAFVLGENKALSRYLQNQDYNAQVDRQNALLEQKRQAEAEKQRRANWTAGAMKAQSGVILPSLDEENKLYMTSAKDLYNNGQDPYSPDSPLFDKRVELDMANSKRKELSTLYTQTANSIKDPNLYTKKSLDEFFNFPNLPYQEAFAKGVPKPELKFSPQEFLPKIKVGTAVETLDSGGRTIKKQYTPEERLDSSIVNGLKNDPKFMNQFHELLDIPEKFDFESLINLPSDPKKVLEDIDKEWKGSEVYRKELTQKIAKEYGVTPSDPQFEAIKQQKAIEAYNASKKLKGYVEGLKEQKRNENPSVYSNTVDNATLNRERNLRKGAEEDATTFRQQLIDGILNNSKSHIDKLKAYLPSGSKVEYKTSRPVDGKSKGGYNFIRVKIPTQIDVSTGKTTIGFEEDISLSKGDASNRLNAILNNYANKVSMDKLNIEGGKPRGEEVSIKGTAKQSQGNSGSSLKGKKYAGLDSNGNPIWK